MGILNKIKSFFQVTKRSIPIYFEQDESIDLRSQENLIKRKDIIGVLYVVDKITGKEWGEDWNDCPANDNASPPYPKRCKNLKKIILKYGVPIKIN